MREYQLKLPSRPRPRFEQTEEDKERAAFLNALDHSATFVNAWENKFLENTIGKRTFSNGQRQVIDELIKKYGDTLKW